MSRSFEMLSCRQGVLVAAPSIKCGQGIHIPLVVIDAFAILIYAIGIPAMYTYVLFVLLKRRGYNHPRFSANFGFLYMRFERRYFWWEFVEMFRKVSMILIQVCAPPMRTRRRHARAIR